MNEAEGEAERINRKKKVTGERNHRLMGWHAKSAVVSPSITYISKLASFSGLFLVWPYGMVTNGTGGRAYIANFL